MVGILVIGNTQLRAGFVFGWVNAALVSHRERQRASEAHKSVGFE